VNVRLATSEDIPQMLKNAQTFISATAYREIAFCEASMTKAFQQMIADGLCIVAEVDGYHLGGVGAVKGPMFLNESVIAAMERFWWVIPDERAFGVGKALLMALHHHAKQAGCEFLMMIALHNDELPKVDAAYTKSGFVPSEVTYLKRL
jgi:GNAT superfamily N-acetyltransferase